MSKYSWYVENLSKPVIRFPRVASPGRLIRNMSSGLHQFERLTVTEYFDALGVLELFSPEDPTSLNSMRYASINPWGYIGYQVGEAILIETGYYRARLCSVDVEGQAHTIPSFHCGSLNEGTWVNGKAEHLFYRQESGEWVLGTDVNCWKGTFTGKDGIASLDHLRVPFLQDHMMVEILRFNYTKLSELLAAAGRDIESCLNEKWWYYENSRRIRVNCTVSGLLACCHLNGVAATVELFTNHTNHCDHLGTSALRYMHTFGGHRVDNLRLTCPQS